ncbi:histidinol dehydrogenase [Scopulibacillus darangshiensis]|uniref:Histidinol dehydrogenase n=2 Tax=Scopulibacillus darangshiensis TaxID=442528 RepID=A0A4R2NSE7_9BACL|nr:histidinol dehydrogenase [Scopulibacillus darangshiensis]
MQWIENGDLSFLDNRGMNGFLEYEKAVREIIAKVRVNGDKALLSYTKQFDHVDLETLHADSEHIATAYRDLPGTFIEVIKEAAGNIRSFHEKQKPDSWDVTHADGSRLGQRVTPLDAVGVYVPGGTAAYPSSVLMGAIPALVAGVKRIVLVSPPQKNGEISDGVLAAANEIGIKEIYQVGGAQAIAALAYGTETIKPVDKIVGPGNIYVTAAKKEVFGTVAIDSLAGPSEIVILADDSANPDWLAADLLSQAEHDPLSMAILVTTSKSLGKAVESHIQKQVRSLPRAEIAKKSLDDFGKIILVEDYDDGIKTVNKLAPEHLEIVVTNPEQILPEVRHAGAIFIGAYSSEPVGDYFAGPNHIIPTNRTARYSSPLSVESFVKRSSIIQYSFEAMQNNGRKIAEFARYEGLEAHARAIEKRIQE